MHALFEILLNILKYNSKFNNPEKQSVFCTGWKACATKSFAVWRIIRVMPRGDVPSGASRRMHCGDRGKAGLARRNLKRHNPREGEQHAGSFDLYEPKGLVPGAGLEPARPCDRGILSPLRLPVPPPRQGAKVKRVSWWAGGAGLAKGEVHSTAAFPRQARQLPGFHRLMPRFPGPDPGLVAAIIRK